jgi:hypothetical protein
MTIASHMRRQENKTLVAVNIDAVIRRVAGIHNPIILGYADFLLMLTNPILYIPNHR